MAARREKQLDTIGLARLLDCTKHLYLEEKQRREQSNSAATTHLVVITLAFSVSAGILSSLFPKVNSPSTMPTGMVQLFLLMGLGVSIMFLLLLLVFTMLAVKVRDFERLCDPKDFAIEASLMKNEAQLMNSMIANSVVATRKNFLVNNKKARLPAAGLQAYLPGLVLLLIALSGPYIAGR